MLGEGDAAEQVISLAGPLQHMQIALPIILEKVESSRGPGQGSCGLPGFPFISIPLTLHNGCVQIMTGHDEKSLVDGWAVGVLVIYSYLLVMCMNSCRGTQLWLFGLIWQFFGVVWY